MKLILALIILTLGFALAIPLSNFGALFGLLSIVIAGIIVLAIMK